MTLLAGIDVGTTNIKALLYDAELGQVVAVSSRPMPTDHPMPHWTEFDPEKLWGAVADCVREVIQDRPADRVRAIAVASMGEAGAPLGSRDEYLFPIIAWHDPRTEPFEAWWGERIDPARLYEINGLAPRHIFGLNKLLWLKRERPDLFRSTRRWLSVEDFVLWKLSGQYVTDYSIASRTLAFDQRAGCWSREVLEIAGIPEAILPNLLPSGSVVGHVPRSAARVTGLSAKTAVVTGGHDHLCGALAAGLLVAESLLDSTGTAEAVLAVTAEYQPSERLRKSGLSHYRYVAPDRYIVQAGLGAAGGALSWLARLFTSRTLDQDGQEAASGIDVLLAEAAGVAVGSNGLLWLPHLVGSGSPENDAQSRGAILGLNIGHGQGEIAHALLEALGYWLRQNVELLEEELGRRFGEIVAIGGATRSPLWTQLKADITGRPVCVPGVSEATAVGAALLAGIGCGVFRDVESAVHSVRGQPTIVLPNPARAEQYAKLYRSRYLPLYDQLKGISHLLAE